MDYRPGTLDDVKEISVLIKSAISEMESHHIYQWDELYPTEEDFISDINKNTLYVAVQEKRIAALYVISPECDDAYFQCQWDSSHDSACVIHRFCVSPDFQHQGIGKQVLLHIENHLKSLGYKSVRLDVFSENPFALSLYTHNGYTQRGTADWRKGRFLLMEKSLL